jgi:Mg2+ and Co2+ transporter CorA
MESVLRKDAWFGVVTGMQPADSNDQRILAAVIVSLIEIREAIEENTAVQQKIADRAGVIEDQGIEMLQSFDEIRRDLGSLQRTSKMHADLIAAIAGQQTLHEEKFSTLAEEKQDRPTVLNGPDTALEGG